MEPFPANEAPAKSAFPWVMVIIFICVGIGVLLFIGLGVALLMYFLNRSMTAAYTLQCKNNMKNIGVAIKNFENNTSFLPYPRAPVRDRRRAKPCRLFISCCHSWTQGS